MCNETMENKHLKNRPLTCRNSIDWVHKIGINYKLKSFINYTYPLPQIAMIIPCCYFYLRGVCK